MNNFSNWSILVTNYNYHGKDILPICLRRIRENYPNIKIRIADDCHNMKIGDDSIKNYKNFITSVINKYNAEIIHYKNKFSESPIDSAMQNIWEYLKEEYIFVIDNDTFLLNSGIIELMDDLFNKNSNIGSIGEFLPPGIDNCFMSTKEFRLPRISTWAFALNMNLLRKNNIYYGFGSNNGNQQDKNYVKSLEKKYMKIFNLREADDGGLFFLKILDKGIDFIDLKDYTKFYDVGDFQIDGRTLRHLCKYYIHLAHYSHISEDLQNSILSQVNKFLQEENYKKLD
ncbi:MAG: glycosyltransferase family A protein [archaeon]